MYCFVQNSTRSTLMLLRTLKIFRFGDIATQSVRQASAIMLQCRKTNCTYIFECAPLTGCTTSCKAGCTLALGARRSHCAPSERLVRSPRWILGRDLCNSFLMLFDLIIQRASFCNLANTCCDSTLPTFPVHIC